MIYKFTAMENSIEIIKIASFSFCFGVFFGCLISALYSGRKKNDISKP